MSPDIVDGSFFVGSSDEALHIEFLPRPSPSNRYIGCLIIYQDLDLLPRGCKWILDGESNRMLFNSYAVCSSSCPQISAINKVLYIRGSSKDLDLTPMSIAVNRLDEFIVAVQALNCYFGFPVPDDTTAVKQCGWDNIMFS